jgi:putative transposase
MLRRPIESTQFTSEEFTGALKAKGVSISMDGRGAWRDNIFVERLWRSIKYEEIYLHAYDSVGQAKTAIARYIDFYNTARPNSSLDKKTPDEFYFATLPAIKQAA